MSSHRFRTVVFGLLLLPLGSAGLAAESLRNCDIGAYERLRDESIYPLFEALQSGDIAVMRSHLSDEMVAEYERLFSSNPEYGAYLRSYYENSSFELIDVVQQDGGYTAIVRIYWSDGRSVDSELSLGGSLPELAATIVSSCE